jgi:hypothetical protein
MITPIQIPVADIHVPDTRYRLLDKARLGGLVDSIRTLGLQTPISVFYRRVIAGGSPETDPWEYCLVAGLHRLESCKTLGLEKIAAFVVELDEVDRDLWEIDENLARVDLNDMERARLSRQRKEIYLKKYPETENPNKRGGPGRGKKREKTSANSAPVSFVADTSHKTGRSPRAVEVDVYRAEQIADDVQEAIIQELPHLNKGVELDALAAMPHDQQRQAVAMVQAGEVKTAREAKCKLNADPAPKALIEAWMKATKAWEKLLAAWELASETDRGAFCCTPAVEDWTPAQPWADWKSRAGR